MIEKYDFVLKKVQGVLVTSKLNSKTIREITERLRVSHKLTSAGWQKCELLVRDCTEADILTRGESSTPPFILGTNKKMQKIIFGSYNPLVPQLCVQVTLHSL